jgi:hypothetical protein
MSLIARILSLRFCRAQTYLYHQQLRVSDGCSGPCVGSPTFIGRLVDIPLRRLALASGRDQRMPQGDKHHFRTICCGSN